MVRITVEARDRLYEAIEQLEDLPATGQTLKRLAAIARALRTVLDEADEPAPRRIRDAA